MDDRARDALRRLQHQMAAADPAACDDAPVSGARPPEPYLRGRADGIEIARRIIADVFEHEGLDGMSRATLLDVQRRLSARAAELQGDRK